MLTTQSLAVWLLVGASLGLTALLALGEAPTAAEPGPVVIEVRDQHIDFSHGKALTARYHFGPKVAKPYFWPVNSPDSTPLTRAWPMETNNPPDPKDQDHVHQKSLWFCHGDVIPEGMEIKHKIKNVEGIDFWSEGSGHGKIVCTRVGKPEVKGNDGSVETINEWRTADDVKILDEKRTLRLHNFGPAQLLILDIDLHASVVPITFGDTKEGSLGVRVRKELTEARGKGQLTNADGHVTEGKNSNKDLKGCWGVVSAWCDYSGPLDGKTAGITIFADPANPYPTCWHSRAYGLMAANPFGREKSGFPGLKGKKELVKLARGEHLKLRYGVLLHQGDAATGKVAEYFKEFGKLRG